ncbi:MAG: 1-acyl-sn-glycerol-3-phosphate acyltransferase, partial [Syntrophales bacterium]|nr:1-acyl-sn-glycerol-3-phosphate acyltransferase [Syntrophales bacterium]
SLLNILFGQTDDTGPLRRAVTFLRYTGQISVLPLQAIDLGAFVNMGKGRTEGELIRDLRAEVIGRIDEERVVLHGPLLKSRDEIIEMVLKDPLLVAKMEELAREGAKRDFPAVVKEARKYLKEIAADYRDGYIEFWYRVLTWLWNNIYDGVVVDSEGMVRIRNIAKKMPFVIIPCHRSHIDYLLLSYVFYQNHIQLPFIAAGINMSFGPFGHIFRKSGAFFMRRSFRGNPLYAEVFAKYLKVLLKEGLPIEFFIEGGRSRTGKMVMPKYGLLSMIISAYQEKVTDDVALVPVYIGYDRIIEEKSYLEELGGGQKTQEKTTDVIKSSKILRKRYGRVYVNIGEAIFLKSYLASQEKPVEEMTVEERQRLYRKIGYEVVLSINRVSVVTPFALVAAGLLSYDRRGIGHGELMDVIEEFYEYLLQRRVSLAATFAHREKAVHEALSLFCEGGIISPIVYGEEQDGDLAETIYSLEEEKRLNLEYYKNNILHYFLPLCFVSTSMVSHREDVIALANIMEDYRFFKRLFWREFIFDDRRDDGEEVHDALAYLHGRGMVSLLHDTADAHLEVRGKGRKNLPHFAGLIANYFESYWVVFRGTAYLRKGPRSERDWLKYLHKLGAVMLKKGEIRRAEALSQANYLNAITFLEDQGVLFTSMAADKKDRRDAKLYHLRDDRMMLDMVRRRLFRFL